MQFLQPEYLQCDPKNWQMQLHPFQMLLCHTCPKWPQDLHTYPCLRVGTKKSPRKSFLVTTYNVLCSHFKSRISKNKGIPVLQILGEFLPFEDVQMIVRGFFNISLVLKLPTISLGCLSNLHNYLKFDVRLYFLHYGVASPWDF